MSQTSYLVEYLSRHLRTAQREEDTDFSPGACVSNPKMSYELVDAGQTLKFVGGGTDPCCWEVYIEDGRLKRELSICEAADSGSYLTSDDFTVEEFNLSLESSDLIQPRITLFLRVLGKGEKDEDRPVIEIQNTISQRNLNVD